MDLKTVRTGLWHLRHGGTAQFRKWLRRRRLETKAPVAAAAVADTANGQLRFTPAELARLTPREDAPRVACILDEFSFLAWAPEFQLVPVTPSNWREQLSAQTIDLLFVESAWRGNDGAWQYQLVGSKAPSEQLRALVEHCRENGIPTVFWNKEDPPHFEDFIDTAKLFDQVFTTDSNLLPQYRERLGHNQVAVLGFAAQPAIHNPLRPKKGFQERDVAFAGMYFAHKYPERAQQMDLLLGGALDVSVKMERGLEIFSRFLGDDERYQFPDELASRVVGTLDYPQMLTAYKAFKVFLNVNSVVDSPSMCSRRVFEILASGTPVVSTRSAAIPQYFTDVEVPVVDSRKEAGEAVRALYNSPELRDRSVLLAQRRIWREHTYAHRAAQVMETVGITPRQLGLPSVSALISTNRPHQVEHALRSAGSQQEVDLQVVLVTHGFEVPRHRLAAMMERTEVSNLVVQPMPASEPLGACLRAATERGDGQVFTKMDDDDLYGPLYLADLLYAMRYADAQVVGKQAHYMYLESMNATLMRFAHREHRYTDMVMGPTITGQAELFRKFPFADLATGEDSDWLRRVSAAGVTMYSADRFSFVQMRSSGHTWRVDDRSLLATGRLHAYGDPRAHAMIDAIGA